MNRETICAEGRCAFNGGNLRPIAEASVSAVRVVVQCPCSSTVGNSGFAERRRRRAVDDCKFTGYQRPINRPTQSREDTRVQNDAIFGSKVLDQVIALLRRGETNGKRKQVCVFPTDKDVVASTANQ